ncbi:unnamed protein product [Rotaria magnacalcarata]|uniref:Uncharacterized protein n=1 Tax=Rotaria magnacalcarata TaxID=392030 RepID=A0A8S2S1K8_9BILA|nr:unnamed protein product [Rotaria magnacalcarata]
MGFSIESDDIRQSDPSSWVLPPPTKNKCLQPWADINGCQVLAYDRLGFGLTERVLDGQLYTRKTIARPDLIQSIIFVARYGLINVQHSVGPIGRLILKSTSIQYMLKFGLTHFLPFKNSYFNKDIARNDATRESYLKPIRDGRIFFKSLILLTQNYDPSSRAGQNTRSTRTRVRFCSYSYSYSEVSHRTRTRTRR